MIYDEFSEKLAELNNFEDETKDLGILMSVCEYVYVATWAQSISYLFMSTVYAFMYFLN